MSILRIRDASGEFVAIPSIKGEKGDKGDAGSVTAVNGIAPDGSGNVMLGAVHPRNLLDNSDFTNPVNQRGQSSYTNGGYCIDRWRTGMASGTTAYAVGGVLWLGKGYGQFVQELIDHHIGEALIFAIYLSDVSSEDIIAIVNDGYSQSATPVHRGLNIVTHTVRADATTLYVGLQNNDQSSDQSCTPVWAALYEGTYTADTLPPYVPKGYAAELAECMRYYQIIPFDFSRSDLATSAAYPSRFPVVFPQTMHNTPTVMTSDYWSSNLDANIQFDCISDRGCAFCITANNTNYSEWHGRVICSSEL